MMILGRTPFGSLPEATANVVTSAAATPTVTDAEPRSEWDAAVWDHATFGDAPSAPAPATAFTSPPKRATYLLYLALSRKDRDVVLGDLAEDFATRLVPEYGLRAARFWYWVRVTEAIWPVLRPRLFKLLTLTAAVKALRAWLG